MATTAPHPDAPNPARLRRLLDAPPARPVTGVEPAAAQPSVPAQDYDRLHLAGWIATAALYGAAGAGWLCLGLLGFVPRPVAETGAGIHVALACAAAAVAGLSAALYAIPRTQGSRLWSVPLGWTHLALVHAGFLYPAWAYHVTRAWNDALWQDITVTGALLLLAGFVLQFVNLLESLLHSPEADSFTSLGVG